MKRNLKLLNLDEWVEMFARVKIGSWEDLDSASVWLRFVENATTSIAELVRREQHHELIKSLGYAFGWLCCFVKFYSKKHPKESFQFISPLSEMTWRKYPGVCYRCTHKFTKEEIGKKDYLACVCLATPQISVREKSLREKYLKSVRKTKHMPSTLDEWARMIRAIYGPNHRELGLSAICLHFLEEVGEVAKGLRALRELGPLEDMKKRRAKIIELEEEIADVFSWILGLLNKLDQILENSREYYKTIVSANLPVIEVSAVAANAMENWKGQAIP
jgi:NTP pyrophosphatase (non-canonical NTP hydrolase)